MMLLGLLIPYKRGFHQGYPILSSSIEELDRQDKYHYFIGIGEPSVRHYFYTLLKKYNLKLINIIDESATSIGENHTRNRNLYW